MTQSLSQRLIYPRPYFLNDLARLRAAGPQGLLLRVARHTVGAESRWLVWPDVLATGDPAQSSAQQIWQRRAQLSAASQAPPFDDTEFILRLFLSNALPPLQDAYLQAEPEVDGHLYLREETTRAVFTGFVRTGDGIASWDEIFVVGAGLARITALNARVPLSDAYADFLRSPAAQERWARTIAVLGPAWERLCLLRYAVVGCGRNGEAVIKELAAIGVGHITAIDGDTLEASNLGEMALVTAEDIGRPKAQAVIARVRKRAPEIPADYRAIAGWNYASAAAQEALAASDVIICCVDSDAARLSAALAAARYHKVLLDAGTGIFPTGESSTLAWSVPQVEMGADVRLILPGDGCLLCRGGVRDADAALVEMYNPERRRQRQQTGHLQRAGSLRCLNNIAASEVLRLLQRLCAGQVSNSQWVRYQEGADGLARQVLPFAGNTAQTDCFCANAGAGRLL